MALGALVTAIKGVETVTRSTVDPKAAVEDAAKLLLTASSIAAAGKTFGKLSLSNGDFRQKFLNGTKDV